MVEVQKMQGWEAMTKRDIMRVERLAAAWYSCQEDSLARCTYTPACTCKYYRAPARLRDEVEYLYRVMNGVVD